MSEWGEAYSAAKIDFIKAYDSLRWSAVHRALQRRNRWIPQWVGLAYMRMLMGMLYIYILAKIGVSRWISRGRGLLQGCPASPFLYMWCLDDTLKPLRRRWRRAGW